MEDPPLPKIGSDEGFMQGHTTKHLVAILNPIAEHVRQLSEEVQHLRKDLAVTDGRADQARAALEQHDRELLALQTSAARSNTRIDKIQLEASKNHADQMRSANDHEVTKTAVGKLEERMGSAAASHRVLQQQHDETSNRLGTLSVDLLSTQADLAGQGDLLGRLREACDGLGAGHAALGGEHRRTRELLDARHADHQALSWKHEHKHQEDARSFGRLAERVGRLESLSAEASGSLHAQSALIRSTTADVEQLRAFLANGKRIEQLQADLGDTIESIQKQNVNITKVEDCMSRLADSFVEEKKLVSSSMRDVNQRITAISSGMGAMEDAQQSHGSQIRKADAFSGKLYRDHVELKERAALMGQRVDALAVWREAASGGMERHALEHQKTRAELWQAGKGLEAASTAVQSLRSDLGELHVTVEKLGSRYETCSHDISGLGRGFQDTFGHVARGEKGMLAPGGARGGAGGLPLIGAAGHTSR